MTTAPNGELRRQDLHLQVQQLVSLRSLPWVPWALVPHLHRYYALLRLPPYPSRVASLSLASRYLACFRSSWCPSRAHARVEAPDHAGAFGRPVPQSGNMVKEIGGSPKFPSSPCACMPRSQTPVVSSALALTRPGLLPSGACKPSAFPSVPLEGYPAVHDYTHFGAQSRGLHPHSLQLRTPIAGLARGVRY